MAESEVEMSEAALALILIAGLSLGGASWSPCTPTEKIVNEMTERLGRQPLIDGNEIMFTVPKDGVVVVYEETPGEGICSLRLYPIPKEG